MIHTISYYVEHKTEFLFSFFYVLLISWRSSPGSWVCKTSTQSLGYVFPSNYFYLKFIQAWFSGKCL